MCSDVDDDDPEEDPQMLAELEQRQEDLIEEFLELAFNKKQEHTEEVKADCKKNSVEKEETKKLVAEAQKKMDQLRRKGTKALKEQFQVVTADEEIPLLEKVNHFKENAESIRETMQTLLKV